MIKDRIIQVIENKRIAKENFYKKIGMTSANFRGKAKETPINSTAIENILSEIPDLNLEWLLTGNGEMFNDKKGNQSKEDSIISKNDIDTLEREYGFFPDIDIVKSYLCLSESRLKNILSSLKADLREKIATNNNIALIAETLLINRDSYYKHRFQEITEKEYMKKMMQDFDPSTTSFENVKLKWITLIYQFQSSNEDLAFLISNMTRYLKRAVDSGLSLGFLKVDEDLINKVFDTE